MANTKKPKPDSDANPKPGKAVDEKTKSSPQKPKAYKLKTPAATPEKKPIVKDFGDSAWGTNSPADSPGAPEKAETTVASHASVAPTPVQPAKRGVFVPALIGGIVAATLGFLAARSEVLDPILPDALKNTEMAEAMSALQETDTNHASELASLRAEIAAIELPDLGPINRQLAAIQAGISPLRAESDAQRAHLRDVEARLDPLNARLEELEKRPMTEGASEAAIAAYDRELAALRDAIAVQRADVEKMVDEARATEAAARALETDAASAARHAQNQATVSRLIGALDGGAPYGAILAELVAAGVPVPDVLAASQIDGVATMAALRDTFPSAARSALSKARAETSDGGGLGSFLQRHLGARSVQPREGDDPDAVLSRAEAALTGGDLSSALQEIAALPEAARTVMQGWADTATTRLTALQAAGELAQSLNTN